MNTLIFKNDDEASVKKAFQTLLVKYGYDKDQALADMNNNAIATANADQWIIELQGSVRVADQWESQKYYTRGIGVNYNGLAYLCIQSHQAQPGWEPPQVPALWNALPVQYPGETYPRWRQPLGSEDAYKMNDRVTHNGVNYNSNINANVWPPPEQWTAL